MGGVAGGGGAVNPRAYNSSAAAALSFMLLRPSLIPSPETIATTIFNVSPVFTLSNGPNEKKNRVSEIEGYSSGSIRPDAMRLYLAISGVGLPPPGYQ